MPAGWYPLLQGSQGVLGLPAGAQQQAAWQNELHLAARQTLEPQAGPSPPQAPGLRVGAGPLAGHLPATAWLPEVQARPRPGLAAWGGQRLPEHCQTEMSHPKVRAGPRPGWRVRGRWRLPGPSLSACQAQQGCQRRVPPGPRLTSCLLLLQPCLPQQTLSCPGGSPAILPQQTLSCPGRGPAALRRGPLQQQAPPHSCSPLERAWARLRPL